VAKSLLSTAALQTMPHRFYSTSSRNRTSYSRIAKTGVLWHYGYVLTELVNIPTTMVLARLLVPHDFGVVAAASFFTRLAARLMNFGFNQALVRVRDIRPEHASSVFLVNMATGALLWAGLALTAPWLAALFNMPETAAVIPVAAFGFVIDAAGSVPHALMTRELKFWKSTVSGWASAILMSVTSITLAFSGFGVWSMVYATLLGTTTQTVILIWLTGWRPSLRFSRDAMREIFSFGMGVHAKRLLDYAALNLDNLVVGGTLGLAALGMYDKAFSLPERAINRINTGGTGVTFRIFAAIREDVERFRAGYCKVIMTASLLTFPLLMACIETAPEMIATLFGRDWLEAAVPLQILCAAGMLRILNQYASTALQAVGMVWSEVWRQVLYVVLLVSLIVALSAWGLPGAAGGVFVATVVMTVLMHRMLLGATGLTAGRLVQTQLPALVCSAFVALAIGGVRRLIEASGSVPAWQLLAIEAATGAAAYLLFLRFSWFPEVRNLVAETLTDFAPRLAHAVNMRKAA
jgi:PST family polysaccharide transporter